jgi:hypothetical protein
MQGSVSSSDDPQMYVVRRDFSGGINSRQQGSLIGETQATVLYNADIGTAGQSTKRKGSVLVGSLASLGESVLGLHAFDVQGETDQLWQYSNNTMYRWFGSGNWTGISYGSLMSGATEVSFISAKESGLAPDDIIVFYNGKNNVMRVDTDGVFQDLGDGASSPPKTDIMCWYGNRIWCLSNDLLYFSDAYDSDYSTAFDRVSNSFRIPVGTERGIVPTRDTGMVVMGKDAIWGLAPSAVPVATDKPEPIVTNRGVVSKKGWVNAGDDIYYFSQDGFRALRRTVQDKLQAGVDYPLSYFLKDEFDSINWSYIERLTMEYFDNKIFIAVPTGAATFDTWVYYPQTQSFMVIQGWSPRCWARYKVSGEEKLYYGKHGRNDVYQAWVGYTDEGSTNINGTAINYQEEGRKEDGGQPLIKKSGGVLKVKALSSGDYTLTVYVSIDDQAYVTLGTVSLAGNSPTLPVTLPFDLASANIVSKSFPLDSLGEWSQMRVKIQHNDVNGSDDITVLSREIITYALTFQDEG